MLTALTLNDFVIVKSLDIEFDAGFSAITGETGAGKSILLDALQAVLGARMDSSLIREGCRKTEIDASFTGTGETAAWLAENGFEEGEEVVLRRSSDLSGRSRFWINGAQATASQARSLGALLVDIHGQQAGQSMVKAAEQLRLLDTRAGLLETAKNARELFRAWREAQTALEEAEKKGESIRSRMERLAWMRDDLEALSPQDGEWERINEEHTILSNASKIIAGVSGAADILGGDEGSAETAIGRAWGLVDGLVRYDKDLSAVAEQVSEAGALVRDASRALRDYLERRDLDEERLAKLDERLSAFFDTASRYRVEPSVLAHLRHRVAEKLDEARESLDVESLRKAEKKAKDAYMAEAGKLSRARRDAAEKLSSDVTRAMQGLAMAGGSFSASIVGTPPSASGLERCEFLVAGHAGTTPRPLARVASGGELSRIGLAIAVTTLSASAVDTLIFDEVDAGIGGAVAETVGRLLQKLGSSRQVLCVTHQPQVASCADHHFRVEKETRDGVTESRMTALDGEGRVEEVARMLGGLTMTPATLSHAREMLRMSSRAS